jgi:hypothetical protein
MASLTGQLQQAEVATAVARGDHRLITVDGRAKFELKNTINTMVDQLNAFAAEVTRVARKAGTEGAGRQAQVPDVGGTWKDLTGQCELHGQLLTGGFATSRKSRRPSPAETFPARSRWTCAAKFFN